MQLTYAHTHKWIKDLTGDLLVPFGKNNSKKIRRLIGEASEKGITFTFEDLHQDFLDWFIPLYVSHISEKKNPKVVDIHNATLGKDNRKYPCYSLTILEHGTPIGGTIFTLRKNHLSIAFRAYKNKWTSVESACSPALYAEYLITEHAVTHGKTKLVHGSDRNLYGVHSNIGVAIFKLSTGCHPVLSQIHETSVLETDDCVSETLILQYPESGRNITNAYLITTQENEAAYEQLYKYPEKLNIHTLYQLH